VVVTDPTDVAHWGVFLTTKEISDTTAKVQVRTAIANESTVEAGLSVLTTLLDRTGKIVGTAQSPIQVAGFVSGRSA
jgi:beta-galactosidase